MTLQELLVIMQNRLLVLAEARKEAVNAGNLQRIIEIDGDLLTTSSTIESLKDNINRNI